MKAEIAEMQKQLTAAMATIKQQQQPSHLLQTAPTPSAKALPAQAEAEKTSLISPEVEKHDLQRKYIYLNLKIKKQTFTDISFLNRENCSCKGKTSSLEKGRQRTVSISRSRMGQGTIIINY